MAEDRAALDAKARNALPDSAFAYIDEKGQRHFPIHDKEHVQKALQLGPRSPMWSKAKGKVMAAAKKFGVHPGDAGRSLEALVPEVRFIADRPEIRSDGEGMPQHITGYAAVFKKTSRRLGNFHEQVMPTAFTEALKAIERGEVNVVCRYNHKDDMVLGTSQAGTLQLAVDERGLPYDVLPPRHREDVLELVQRGDVRYSSFAFRVAEPGTDDTWGESESGLPMRSLHNVELVDVAPVLDPAYKDTSASARSLNGAIESLASWVNADPAEVRSMLEAGQASRFFKRTDRPSVPPLDTRSAQDREETRVLDDEAVAIRRAAPVEEPAPEGDYMPPEDERSVRTEDEIRAAKGKEFAQMCRKFKDHEPCVRPAGHEGNETGEGCKGLCYGRHNGLPCNQEMGHEGPHTPIRVDSRDNEGEPAEARADEPPAPKTLTGPEAMTKMFARRKNLTALPD
jgi:HK97 family phage prohead protease